MSHAIQPHYKIEKILYSYRETEIFLYSGFAGITYRQPADEIAKGR
ncbi:hypothetical protein BH18THE2_BH18THE2_38230 [soil metagenome]